MKHYSSPKRNNSVLIILLLVFFISASITGYLVFSAVKDIFADWRGQTSLEIPDGEGTAIPLLDKIPNINEPLQDEGHPPAREWDGRSRVNVLLMGLDYRDWLANEGPPRTDTMILFTLDPQTQTAGMLSIPRDLWVEIPGYGYHKINQAYQYGELNHYDGGGPQLALETVEQFLDIQIPYYVQVDFGAFIKLIDEIGGVKLEVPEQIVVDPLGDNNTTVLQPGLQTLPGDIALAYARARNTPGSDFDRAKRQQQVIMAVRKRVLDFQLLPTLISKSPVLYQELSSSVKSNLSLYQIIQIAWIAQQIPEDKIMRRFIGPNDVVITTSWDGMSILAPIPEKIYLIRDEMFAQVLEPEPTVQIETSEKERMIAENARVLVQNGTMTPGLAANTNQYLLDMGVHVVEVGNADQFMDETTIIDFTGKPYTISFLSKVLGVPEQNILHRYDPQSEIDVQIILGSDWAESNPMP